VVANTGLFDTVNDAWISGQLSSKIVFDRNVSAINYKIETVNSIIYLIGAAQSQRELDRVFAYAREIPNVIRVVSHVRVKQAP
jgi:osmotically-inducible protein OsmY